MAGGCNFMEKCYRGWVFSLNAMSLKTIQAGMHLWAEKDEEEPDGLPTKALDSMQLHSERVKRFSLLEHRSQQR
jgi:hypothetical protein